LPDKLCFGARTGCAHIRKKKMERELKTDTRESGSLAKQGEHGWPRLGLRHPLRTAGLTIGTIACLATSVHAQDGAPTICDHARSARARGSPAAPRLEAECRAGGGEAPEQAPDGTSSTDELAALGQIIAGADRLTTELRNRQPESSRRGFDIGLAVAENDTAWGPGKQRILQSLVHAEQEGFRIAVSFSMDRNRNPEYAAIGAAVAERDPELARDRAGDRDLRYRLGFDIATGIFGNRALGAQGNTATGPGSMAIRAALSPPAQRGFDASMKLHLSRGY
jgi:hypothetical protein